MYRSTDMTQHVPVSAAMPRSYLLCTRPQPMLHTEPINSAATRAASTWAAPFLHAQKRCCCHAQSACKAKSHHACTCSCMCHALAQHLPQTAACTQPRRSHRSFQITHSKATNQHTHIPTETFLAAHHPNHSRRGDGDLACVASTTTGCKELGSAFSFRSSSCCSCLLPKQAADQQLPRAAANKPRSTPQFTYISTHSKHAAILCTAECL